MSAFLTRNPCPILKSEPSDSAGLTREGSSRSVSSSGRLLGVGFSNSGPLSRPEFADGGDDAVLVLLGEADRRGQAEGLGDDPGSHLAAQRLHAGVRLALVHGLEDGTGLDALPGQQAHQLAA